jgi:hypothetical protein
MIRAVSITRRLALASAICLAAGVAHRADVQAQAPRAGDARAGTGSASLPPPWQHRDIGAVAVAGDARHEDGTFTVVGTLDIWGKADGFHYAYRTLVGDGAIVARVTAVEKTNNHAKAGVMIRESLDDDARHATMVVTPVDGTQFLRRKEAAGLTTNTNPGHDRGTLPYWVKLVRKGDEFLAYESPDGKGWALAGSDTVAMNRRAYIGLVASSHQKTVTNTATLDRVTLTPESPEKEPGR